MLEAIGGSGEQEAGAAVRTQRMEGCVEGMIFDPNTMKFEKPIKKKPSAGGKANGVGSIHEKSIEAALKHFELDFERHVHLCDSIYGSKLYNDFVVRGIPPWVDGLIIESKYQGSSGSADEKFPFLVANIKEKFPHPCVILYSLDGAKPKSVEWLVKQQDGVKLIAILKYDKFPTWLHQRMLPYDD